VSPHDQEVDPCDVRRDRECENAADGDGEQRGCDARDVVLRSSVVVPFERCVDVVAERECDFRGALNDSRSAP
jgi:hypothetical protein